MRGIFFGTSAFAVPALRTFAAQVDCVLVVTQPDRPGKRGQKLQPTPVKLAARELGLRAIEPEKLRDALPELREARPDLLAVASYGKIVPQAILDLPRLAALNVHPSLLPLYRGATPLQSQLRDGVTQSGVTVIAMDAGMDTGDIVARAESPIGPGETYGELHDRFATLGAELLGRACEAARDDTLVRVPQDGLCEPTEIARTLTRPLTKADLAIDWRWPALRIVDHVRSLSPQPGARAMLDGEEGPVKILEAHVAGAAQEDDSLAIVAGDGARVVVERLIPPNRSSMDGRAYLAARGRKR